jgi:uracil phosphoribosyltransferase
MEIFDLSKSQSIFNHFISEIRDVDIQKDPMRFRRNLERIGEIIGYEISKKLNYSNKEITTPLGVSEMNLISDKIVIASILRAGLPMHNGLLNYFDRAENCFISAYRKHTDEDNFIVEVEYLASPKIDDKILIISDPMLATGRSMVLCYEAILTMGSPTHTHIVSAIGSTQGVEYVQENLPENVTLWLGAIDSELTSKAYIVPGLGDAGDLAFGGKY